VSALLTALRDARFLCADEAELQAAVARVLDEAKIGYQREVRLSARDRVDFLVDGGVALELKVQTTSKNLLRQVLRYAEHPIVREIVIGSTTHHGLSMPAEAHGKPVRCCHLRGW
jgi:acetyl-CoA carboxylase carboxyltransferase component